MKRVHALAVCAAVLAACASEDKPTPIPEGGLPLTGCDPAAGNFATDSTNITLNPFLPLPVGKVLVYEGTEDGVAGRLVVTVLAETRTVAQVATRVVEEEHRDNGVLVERSRNFFAQAADGTVCYFGEEVDEFDAAGNVTGHPGAWQANGADVRPGILMPEPQAIAVGAFYSQEIAPGVALDRAEVVAKGETVAVPLGTFTDTFRTREWTPLEPDNEEFKSYASGVGLVVDAALTLRSVTP